MNGALAAMLAGLDRRIGALENDLEPAAARVTFVFV
jgi:hypothetical protein